MGKTRIDKSDIVLRSLSLCPGRDLICQAMISVPANVGGEMGPKYKLDVRSVLIDLSEALAAKMGHSGSDER